MMWNWQLSAWPNWLYLPDALEERERQFLFRAGKLVGMRSHIADGYRDAATVDLLVEEAMKTSLIEGEYLDRSSVQSSLRRAFGLKADSHHGESESGVAEMMADGYRTWQERLDAETLHRWHRMVCRGRRDLDSIGDWRRGESPMQVVSGRPGRYRVHFEAPPASRLPDEMKRFFNWYNSTALDGPNPMPALARAGLAHLYFITVHPYEDGNGRIARAICDKALAQSVDQPVLTGLSIQIEKSRNEYYQQLNATNRTLSADGWLEWFSNIILGALDRSRCLLEHSLFKAQLMDRLHGRINDRQTKALLRIYAEGPDGFKGGLSASNYMRITRTTPATARRDLGQLVELGALDRTGERRGTRYWLPDGHNG